MTHKKWFRIIVPVVLVLVWFGVASVGGPTFGKISEVSTNNQASFLPKSADSTKVQELQRSFNTGQAIPAIVLVESEQSLTAAEIGTYSALKDKLAKVDGVQKPIIGPIPSEDTKALQFIVPVSTDAEIKTVVEEMRAALPQTLPDSINIYITGPAGLSADLSEAFGGIDSLLLIVALAAVFIILLFVYRALLLPILVLFNAIFALSAAIIVIYLLAKNGIIELNGQSQGILSILVIGAATDYSLLLVARYKEALASSANKWDAMKQGIKGSFAPISASAATVILALLCLLFSDLNSNRSLGPIAATGIVLSYLATLTFLPALLLLFGKVAFWPSKIAHVVQNKKPSLKTGKEELRGVWRKAGNLVSAHPRRIWVTIIVLLVISSFGLLQLKASGVPQTDLVLSASSAREGQKAIARHYNAGAGAQVLIAAPQQSRNAAVSVITANEKLAEITAYSERGQTADLQSAKVVDGKVLLAATLTIDPYSEEAESVISSLRGELSKKAKGTLVGGTTAVAVDTSTTAQSDLKKIIPLVLLMIFAVLAILLRSLLAPFILVMTVVLSFAATLGIAALVFNGLFNFPGADPAVPLFGFVFLVALGIDYNIFLITRTREEAFKYGTRPAVLHSLGKTGGVITSAGIVLAATFAALGIIPILFLAQIAFIVAFGVLIDTFIVRTLLVPALFTDIGAKVWWPSKKLIR